MSIPDYPLEQTLDFKFTSRAFATGIPTVLAGSPVVEIYEDNSDTQITDAETLSVDFNSVVGLNNLRVVATAANGFESGKTYSAVLSVGTVDGVSVVGEVVAQWSIERSPALRLNTTATEALEDQFDGTGLVGDTYPLRQDQGASISGGLAVHEVATSVGTIVGSEQGLADTGSSNTTYWTGDDDGAGAEFIFRFVPTDTDSSPGDLHFEGFYNEPGAPFDNSATLETYNFQNVQWDTQETFTNAAENESHDNQLSRAYASPGSDTIEGVPVTIGDVLVKFQQTSQETGDAVLNIDKMTVGFISAALTAGEIVDEWESQSQDDPSGFHVNLQEWIGVVPLALSSQQVQTDLTAIHGTGLNETAGELAARFSGFFGQATAGFSVATPLADFQATGFNTVEPDPAGTASTLHDTTNALINGISNVTRLSVGLATYLERPPSSNKAVKVVVALKDLDGNMEDPDGNQLALTVSNSGGTSRNSLLFQDFALTTALDAGTGTFSTYKQLERTSTGLYFFYIKVAFDATEEEWLAQFGWEEDAIALYELRATQVTDAANDLGILLTRVTEARMAELDPANLPADINLILEGTGTTLPAQITALENLSSAGAQAAADAALVANHLDHLFKTDYDPASKPGTATALLNELVQNNGSGVSQFTVIALVQAPSGSGSTPAVIADAVWNELQAGHVIAGSFGLFLDAKVSDAGGGGNIGSGSVEVCIVTKDSSNNPLDGVEVWITTDSAGTNVVAGVIVSDAAGKTNFLLDAASYYAWRQLAGTNFTNPQAFTVVDP